MDVSLTPDLEEDSELLEMFTAHAHVASAAPKLTSIQEWKQKDVQTAGVSGGTRPSV